MTPAPPTYPLKVDRWRACELAARFPGWAVVVGMPVALRWGRVLAADTWQELEAKLVRAT